MLLEFEGIHTNFSWGRNNISLANMELIGGASLRHGFQAIGLAADQLTSALIGRQLAAA
jgi:fatty aldehyde-generating acyl-ACP reductase